MPLSHGITCTAELSLELMSQTTRCDEERREEMVKPRFLTAKYMTKPNILEQSSNPSTFIHQVRLISIRTHPASNAWTKTPACCCSIRIASEYEGDSRCGGDVESRDPSGVRGEFVMGTYPRRKFGEVCCDSEDGGQRILMDCNVHSHVSTKYSHWKDEKAYLLCLTS